MYATFFEYPHLEHDQDVLHGRAQQLIEYHLRLWPEMTNDVPAYTRLFIPAFLFGYRLGHAMVQEVNAEERETMVQGLRSMDNAVAFIFLHQIIQDRMQEMGVWITLLMTCFSTPHRTSASKRLWREATLAMG